MKCSSATQPKKIVGGQFWWWGQSLITSDLTYVSFYVVSELAE